MAAAAAEAAGEAKEFEDVIPNAVRLFKYLVPDYYEDFKLSTAKWVREHVEVICQPQGACQPLAACQPQAAHQSETQSETQPLVACQPQAARQPYAALMQIVYTDRVIPKDLLRLWSNIADKLQTVVIEGQDMETARVEIEEEWTRFILTSLLHVDSHPALSRFFLSG